MGNAIKEMRHKNSTGYDVPGDVLKMSERDGLRLMTELISNIYETVDCPRSSVNLQRLYERRSDLLQIQRPSCK